MAPKKKGKGKKDESKSQEKETTEWDDLDVPSLHDVVNDFRQKLHELQKKRNYSQVERDAVRDYYDVTRDEIRDAEATSEALDRHAELAKDEHRVERSVYTHKVRHLEYEHENELEEISREKSEVVVAETNDHESRTDDLKNVKISLKEDRREKCLVYAEEIKKREVEYGSKLVDVKGKYDKDLEELKGRCDARLKEMEYDLELRRKLEIHDVEERKHLYIHETVKKHDEAVERLKSYYKDIISTNLNEVQSLRQELAEKENKVGRTKDEIGRITSENKRLEEPLVVALKKVNKLLTETKNREKDVLSLRNTRARLSLLQKRLRSLKTAHALLEKNYLESVKDRDTLSRNVEGAAGYAAFFGAAADPATADCTDAHEKNLALEHALTNLRRDNEVAEAQLEDVVAAASMDVEEAEQITAVLGDLLSEKNGRIEGLRMEVAAAKKGYGDCAVRCEEKLVLLGIPEDEVLIVVGGD